MSAPEIPPTSPMTAEEAFESLSGFDELAIAGKFGAQPANLAESQQTMFLRALVFVELRRAGENDADAYQGAMSMSLKAAHGYFTPEPEDKDADNAIGALGGQGSAVGEAGELAG